ncbi:ATP-dependent Clp protease ATP-binding subunit, partial [Actinomadura logoneensis]
MTNSPFGSFFDDPFRGFDLLSGRVFGGEAWPPARPGVQRVDVGRLLSEQGRELLVRAVRNAGERGAPDLDTLDILTAAAQGDPARALLRSAGADPDALTEAIDEALPGTPGSPPTTFTPSAKRALLDAQRISNALGSSYIGPEHLVLALAANPDAASARLLASQGVTADDLRTALAGERRRGAA